METKYGWHVVNSPSQPCLFCPIVAPAPVLLLNDQPVYSQSVCRIIPKHAKKDITCLPLCTYSGYIIMKRMTFKIMHFCILHVRDPWWKPISWSSRRTVIVLTLLPDAVWNSTVSVATENGQFLHATWFSTRRYRSVSLCGLPLCGGAVVAPRHFHFTVTT